jgi:hypothetical protein
MLDHGKMAFAINGSHVPVMDPGKEGKNGILSHLQYLTGAIGVYQGIWVVEIVDLILCFIRKRGVSFQHFR